MRADSVGLPKVQQARPIRVYGSKITDPKTLKVISRLKERIQKSARSCKPLDLSGMNLTVFSKLKDGVDFSFITLENLVRGNGRVIEQYPLRRARLRSANLTGVHLNGADLTKANLERANLTNADFRGAFVYRGSGKITGNELKRYLNERFPTIVGLDTATFE